jgi:threonine aldolase
MGAPAPVDLRSDTVTRPTAAMRAAIAGAEVGDDVYEEDPTVNALERRVAELTGKEAALLVPSGTMANQIAIGVWCTRGDEVYLHRNAHILEHEQGGIAALWGAQARPLRGHADGRLDGDELAAAVPAHVDDPHVARPRLVCVENTFMYGGGRVQPAAALAATAATARSLGLRLHLDGARIFNAAVASGTPPAELCAPADSVQLCLSKGLGAPVGSMLAGPAEAIGRGRRLRKLLGGGMRQAGVLAAAGLYALEHHVERLADDHRRARRLAEALAGCERVSLDPSLVETNIVVARLRSPEDDPEQAVLELREAGVLCSPLDRRTLRLVTHLDVDDEALERAVAACRRVLGRASTR